MPGLIEPEKERWGVVGVKVMSITVERNLSCVSVVFLDSFSACACFLPCQSGFVPFSLIKSPEVTLNG